MHLHQLLLRHQFGPLQDLAGSIVEAAHLTLLFVGEGHDAEHEDLVDLGSVAQIARAFGRDLRIVVKNNRRHKQRVALPRLADQHRPNPDVVAVGRLFDAVAALLGFTRETSFEGQAASWLEYQARQCSPQRPYLFEDLDFRAMLRAVLQDRLAGRPRAEIASAFHLAMAAAVVAQIRALCSRHALNTVASSGCVFQNELLLESIVSEMDVRRSGVNLIFNNKVPANDGGIALGQAALASVLPS